MLEKTPFIEGRKAQRRIRGERRQSIRWEPDKKDRRRLTGRRKEDMILDGLKSMYGRWTLRNKIIAFVPAPSIF